MPELEQSPMPELHKWSNPTHTKINSGLWQGPQKMQVVKDKNWAGLQLATVMLSLEKAVDQTVGQNTI